MSDDLMNSIAKCEKKKKQKFEVAASLTFDKALGKLRST